MGTIKVRGLFLGLLAVAIVGCRPTPQEAVNLGSNTLQCSDPVLSLNKGVKYKDRKTNISRQSFWVQVTCGREEIIFEGQDLVSSGVAQEFQLLYMRDARPEESIYTTINGRDLVVTGVKEQVMVNKDFRFGLVVDRNNKAVRPGRKVVLSVSNLDPRFPVVGREIQVTPKDLSY